MKFRVPTARLYRLLIVLLLIAGARRVTYTSDALRDMQHQYGRVPFTLTTPWPTVADVSRAGTRCNQEQMS